MVFIVVRHGDKKETLFNANCMVSVLLDNIKLRCGFDKTVKIDLCDKKGCMCRLEDHPKDNGVKYVRERECYVLVQRQKKENGNTKYKSLLKGMESTDPELLAQIEGRQATQESIASQHPNHEDRRMSKTSTEKRSSGHSFAIKKKSRAYNR